MKLSNKEIRNLISFLVQTREHEIDCAECMHHVSEFAEQELAGKTVKEGLKSVEHHLNICSECHEEYEILKYALKKIRL